DDNEDNHREEHDAPGYRHPTGNTIRQTSKYGRVLKHNSSPPIVETSRRYDVICYCVRQPSPAVVPILWTALPGSGKTGEYWQPVWPHPVRHIMHLLKCLTYMPSQMLFIITKPISRSKRLSTPPECLDAEK